MWQWRGVTVAGCGSDSGRVWQRQDGKVWQCEEPQKLGEARDARGGDAVTFDYCSTRGLVSPYHTVYSSILLRVSPYLSCLALPLRSFD